MNSKFTEMIDKRQQANRDILAHLYTLIELCPNFRFGQILANFDVIQYQRDPASFDITGVKDPFYEESVETLQRVSNKIKQFTNEKV